MRCTLVYPPGAYPYMPYLAPYLLAGHLRERRVAEPRVLDLNIRWHQHLWSEDGALDAARALQKRGDRTGSLLAELVAEHGAASWRALRDRRTFEDPGEVRRAAAVLAQGERTWRRLDAPWLARGQWPDRGGAWPALVASWQDSALAGYLRGEVEGGAIDDADAVGVCVAYLGQLLPAMLLADLVKRRRPAIPVVFGGNAVTHLLREFTSDASVYETVDWAVPYEGEHSLEELLTALRDGGPAPALNVATRRQGAVEYRQDLLARPRLSPQPDFSDLEHRFPTPDVVYPLLTSKGCYWGKCTFCTHHEGYGQGYYRFGDEQVARSVAALAADGARAFYFVDEALPPRTFRGFVDLFARLRAEHTAPDVRWTAECRLERALVTDEAVDALAQSGCRLLVNGVESGSPRVLGLMHKGIDPGLVAEHARRCAEHGRVRVGWMLFLGFPGETPEESAETLRFLSRNREHVDFASIGTFGLERGSPVWEDPGRFGIVEILDRDRPYRVNFDYRLRDGTVVSQLDLRRLLHALVDAHPEVRPLLDGAVDRALALFFPDKPPRSQPTPARAAPVTWRSALWGVEARLDVERGRMEVRHGRGAA